MGLYGNKILNINETVFYKGDGISIHVNISDKFNYGDQAYFKVYDNENYAKATKVARIQVKDAKYEIHSDPGGKDSWELNSKDKKNLITALKKKPNIGRNNKDTVYDAILDIYNINDIDEMPDYKKL